MRNRLDAPLVRLAVALLFAPHAAPAAEKSPARKEAAPNYASKAPRFAFASTLPEQERQLAANPLLAKYRELRRRQAADPHTPLYHFSSPEARLNDPNGLCFWQGRWHLFYQANPPEDGRWHWAHAVSDDLIHWRDLPFALFPDPEEQSYSGSVVVEPDRVIAMYHGRNLGNMVAISRDPLLLNWEKVTGDTVIPLEQNGQRFHFLSAEPLPYRVYDPCIWKKEGVYYSLSGSVEYTGPAGKPVPAEFLFRSRDLVKWEFVHQFLEGDRFTRVGDDGACPYFWPIGDRHILLFFSHTSSGQYWIGDYDTRRDKFAATAHGRFNFGAVQPGGVHAPSAAPDGQGGVIAFFNVNPAMATKGANGVMTLPRRLTLIGREELGIEPAGDLAALRGAAQRVTARTLPANEEWVLPGIGGQALEIAAEIDPRQAPMVELNVLRSPGREEFTRVLLFRDRDVTSRFLPPQQKLSVVTLDGTRASERPEFFSRPPETASVLIPPDEPFRLRVFVDRGIVEVFVNGRQCLALRVHPGRADSLGVSLRAQGRDAELRAFTAWPLKRIFD